MPTYEYACRECGHRFDVVQSFSEEPLTVCPSCGGALRKVFSPAGIIFKGSGYYATDSRAAPSGPTAPGGKGTETPGGQATSEGGAGSGGTEPAGGAGDPSSGEKSTSGSDAKTTPTSPSDS